jgi:hypothetical protein
VAFSLLYFELDCGGAASFVILGLIVARAVNVLA